MEIIFIGCQSFFLFTSESESKWKKSNGGETNLIARKNLTAKRRNIFMKCKFFKECLRQSLSFSLSVFASVIYFSIFETRIIGGLQIDTTEHFIICNSGFEKSLKVTEREREGEMKCAEATTKNVSMEL